ncbi:hypothetical protein MUN81_02225 [Hymenobacter sp. 5317J-9]|uniref:hypothetical protein n=1 Tax=Hymenobacter sp. 5317J-9 TaxID=2932250 RepID=UPI001FD6E579|nr:hypothetical protein [Hymenobacter sp. 5317J-9]UOQ98315.1 hypothetical protein MUN81_02225 [Hymenobacter sp. 5317J-9]
MRLLLRTACDAFGAWKALRSSYVPCKQAKCRQPFTAFRGRKLIFGGKSAIPRNHALYLLPWLYLQAGKWLARAAVSQAFCLHYTANTVGLNAPAAHASSYFTRIFYLFPFTHEYIFTCAAARAFGLGAALAGGAAA